MLVDAVRIARWAGELEEVDKRGRQLLVGLVEARDGGAGPGWRLHAWEHDDEAVVRGWSALFDAWTLLAPVPPAALRGVFAVLAGQAVDQAPQLLSFLHLVDGPVAESELLELLRRGLDERRVGGGPGGPGLSPVPHAASAVSAVRGTCREPQIDTPPAPSDVAAVLDWMLDGLAAVGALTRRNDAAELSPLGHWAVRAKLEEICTVAQTAAGHIEQSAFELLNACADYSPGPARAEYRAWVAARPADRAVAELLDAAQGDDCLLYTYKRQRTRCCGWRSARTRGSPRRTCWARTTRPGSGWTRPRRCSTTVRRSCWWVMSRAPRPAIRSGCSPARGSPGTRERPRC